MSQASRLIRLHLHHSPVDFPNGPWEKVGIDITRRFDHATWDCCFAIALVDYYSKWPEVAFAPNDTAEVVIRFLTTVFSREGNPSYFVSDIGYQFISHAFANFLRERGIRHLRSSVYYLRANGAIERFNRVLKNACRQLTKCIDHGNKLKPSSYRTFVPHSMLQRELHLSSC